MRLKPRTEVSAHLARRPRTASFEALHPLDGRGLAHPEARRSRPPAHPSPNHRVDHPVAQVLRICTGHPRWPPPSQQVESEQCRFGNPNRFKLDAACSRARRPRRSVGKRAWRDDPDGAVDSGTSRDQQPATARDRGRAGMVRYIPFGFGYAGLLALGHGGRRRAAEASRRCEHGHRLGPGSERSACSGPTRARMVAALIERRLCLLTLNRTRWAARCAEPHLQPLTRSMRRSQSSPRLTASRATAISVRA